MFLNLFHYLIFQMIYVKEKDEEFQSMNYVFFSFSFIGYALNVTKMIEKDSVRHGHFQLLFLRIRALITIPN